MKLRIKSLFLSLFLFSGIALFAQETVSDKDLDTFIEVYQVMMVESQQAQMAILGLIEKEEIEPNRFAEINASMNGAAVEGAKEPTEAEKAKYNKILTGMESLQVEFETKISKLLEANSWTEEKFQKIGEAIDASEELQTKLQQKMMTQ